MATRRPCRMRHRNSPRKSRLSFRSGHANFRRLLLLVGSLVFLMCASSESHLGDAKLFLTACDADHPCADANQDCYCVCTIACDSDTTCQKELAGVGLPKSRIVCHAPTCGAASDEDASVCDVSCEKDADCLPLSALHGCVAGYCRAPLPEADGGGGAGGAAVDPRCPGGGEFQDLEGGFCLLAREVSVGEFKTCVTAGDCTEPQLGNYFTAGRDEHPVNALSPGQASSYCASVGGTLPTRAQWEAAATSGGQSIYPWGDTVPGTGDQPGLLCAVGNFSDTCRVGSYPAGDSTSAVSDLVGNVAEFVVDGAGYCLAGGYYADTDGSAVRGDACVAFDDASLSDGSFDPTQLGFRCVFPAQ